MQYNKGMLSDARAEKQKRLESKNPVELCTSILNILHAIPLRGDLTESEKKAGISQCKREIKNLKHRLPKHFYANIHNWINNRDAWLNR